jgi:hypothetical protein
MFAAICCSVVIPVLALAWVSMIALVWVIVWVAIVGKVRSAWMMMVGVKSGCYLMLMCLMMAKLVLSSSKALLLALCFPLLVDV